jgi:hypothetical protein
VDFEVLSGYWASEEANDKVNKHEDSIHWRLGYHVSAGSPAPLTR